MPPVFLCPAFVGLISEAPSGTGSDTELVTSLSPRAFHGCRSDNLLRVLIQRFQQRELLVVPFILNVQLP